MKTTRYQVISCKQSEAKKIIESLSPILYVNEKMINGEFFSTIILGGSSVIALEYFDHVDKYKLTESQIENNRLFSDYHNRNSFSLSELRSIPGIIESDVALDESTDFKNNFNNCELIQEVTYRTDDQPHKKYHSREVPEYKKYLWENNQNFRTKFFYIKKYDINQVLTECENRSMRECLLDLISNYKDYAKKGFNLTAQGTDIVFNSQGVLILGKDQKLLPCYNPLTDCQSDFVFKNINKVIKLYSLLTKQFDTIRIKLESEKSFSLLITASHYPKDINYRFTFDITEQLEYELKTESNKLDIYTGKKWLQNDLVIDADHIDRLNKDEIGLQISKYIATASKVVKKKVFKKNTEVNLYLTPLGHYIEQISKKESKVYQICPSPCNEVVYTGFQKILPCAIKLNVTKFYDVMSIYWLQDNQKGIDYKIVLNENEGYQVQAIKNNSEVLASINIAPYYGDNCIVTRWLSTQV